MYRAIFLVAAVVLAGCVGGVGPDATGSSSDPPDADWADGDGIDTTALAEHHFEVLRDAGSFTVNHSDTILVDGEPRPAGPRPDGYYPPSNSRHRVDLQGGRYLGESVTVGHRRSIHFVSPSVTAAKRFSCPSDCDPEHRYQERPDGDTRSQRIDRYRTDEAVGGMDRLLRGVTVDFDYAYDGTVDRGGETLHRYRAEQPLDSAPPPFSEPPRGTATVLVTEDGVVRRVEIEYTGSASVTVDGEEQTVEVTQRVVQTYTAVGETTVERPGWVDTAADEDSPASTETGEN